MTKEVDTDTIKQAWSTVHDNNATEDHVGLSSMERGYDAILTACSIFANVYADEERKHDLQLIAAAAYEDCISLILWLDLCLGRPQE